MTTCPEYTDVWGINLSSKCFAEHFSIFDLIENRFALVFFDF